MGDGGDLNRAGVTQSWSGELQARPAGDPELPRRWRAVRWVAQGGQAEVWLAHDGELDESVAVKLFRPELTPAARERLRREVRLGRSLQHPNLVRIYELIEVGERLAIVMEWVPGGSLAERLQRHGPLAISEVIEVARQVLEALAHLHARQVVHRDVKPSNLLVGGDGEIKLADLGLARSIVEGSEVTWTCAAVGTPAYMSPEQLLGWEAGPASDLFALGATLFELATGQRLFDPPRSASGEPRLTTRAPSPRRLRPDCPAWLARFILRLLERQPGDRFRDARQALTALERRRLLVSPRWRRGLLGGALAASLVVAVGVALWLGVQRDLTSVTTAGSQVIALDQRGRELWHREFPGFEPVPIPADVLGDPTPEVIVALRNPPVASPEGTTDLIVLAGDGAVAASAASTLSQLRIYFPDFAPSSSGPFVTPMDLDGDGSADLAWTTPHARWYPTVLGGWNLRARGAPRALFVNSGSLHEVVSADLDGDGRPEVVATGINNPLGFQRVLLIVPVGQELERAGDTFASPDLATATNDALSLSAAAVPAYVPLGPFAGAARIASAGPAGITLKVGEEVIALDASGNPASHGLAGRGWKPRARFWRELGLACRALESGVGSLSTIRAGLAQAHGAVLAEPPMQLATTLLLARSLARAGAHEAAAAALAEAAVEMPDELDLPLRQGEQLAIAGRFVEAEEALLRSRRLGLAGRGPLDALVALALLDAWQGESVEGVAAFWESQMSGRRPSTTGQDLRALAAFAAADWASPLLDEAGKESVLVAAPFIRLWAAHERGAEEGVIQLAAERLSADPELVAHGRLLLARLATRRGHTRQAGSLARTALEELERRGRESWEVFAWVALAERVLAEALIAAGRPAEAASHLARAHRLAPGAWFGQRPGVPPAVAASGRR